MLVKINTRSVVLTLTALLTLGGCANIPPDSGLSSVEKVVSHAAGRSIPLPGLDSGLLMSEEEVTRLLAFPLKPGDAERIALYRNPLIRMKLANVGLSQADYAQAGRMRNPGISFTRYSTSDYEATTLFDIGGLILMPLRRKVAAQQLKISEYRAAGDIVNHIHDTRATWILAVAEGHKTLLMEETLISIEAANQLTRQMAALGHSSLREATESELSLAEFRTALSRQRIEEINRREELIRMLGLWGSDANLMNLPQTLEPLPISPVDNGDIARFAVSNRIDVEMARENLIAVAANMKLTRRSPFINVLELGPVIERSSGESDAGFEIELTLPLFDWGGVKNDRARMVYQQALAGAELTALSAASEAREALHTYRRAWDIVTAYQQRVLPLQNRINDEELLRYNGMLISVFDLLKNVKRRLATHINYVDKLKDYWLAETRLRQVMVSSGSTAMNFSVAATASPSDEGGH